MKHEIKIKCCGYKYAPELCNIFVNGQLYAPRGSQTAHDIALLFIAGKEKEARDKIKRDIRKDYKKPQYVTIGFFQEGSASRYFFTRQLYARRDDLSDKLRIYKEYKHFLESNNCIVTTYDVKTADFIPGATTAPQAETITEKADIHRPIIIKLV